MLLFFKYTRENKTIMKSIPSMKIFLTAAILLICFFSNNKLNAQDSLSQYILTPKAGPEPRINGPKVLV